MLKIDQETITRLEKNRPAIGESIRHYDGEALPVCARCASKDTASVHCGIVGRTISLAAATTKFKLIPNGPRPGEYFCNACKEFFD